jgi:hypothetical protein
MLKQHAGQISTEEADSLWLRSLSQIKTSYGRLVYLAGLRNPDTGKYEHYGAFISTAPDAISHSLEKKKADIDLYISGIDQVDKADLVDAWLRLTPYKNLVPGSIQGPERQRHVSDFEAILGLLKNVYGVASPDRDA